MLINKNGAIMREKKMNKIALRSRKLIREAFLELLKEKSIEKITVTDVIRKADINRSTFYVHYPDVRGILDEIYAELLEFYRDIGEKYNFNEFFDDPESIIRITVQYVLQNKELYRLLSESTIASQLVEEMKHMLIQTILDMPMLQERKITDRELVRIRFVISGLIDIYRSWLIGKIDIDVDTITDEIVLLLSEVTYMDKNKL